MPHLTHAHWVRRFLLYVLLQTALSATCTGSSDIHRIDSIPTTPCAAAADLKHVARQINEKLKSQRSNIRAAMQTLLTYAVGAAANTGDTSLGASALLAAAGNKITSAQQALSNIDDEAHEVIAGLSSVAGIQETLAEVNSTEIASKNGEARGTWLLRTGTPITLKSLGTGTSACNPSTLEDDRQKTAKELKDGLYPITLFQLKKADTTTAQDASGPRICAGTGGSVSTNCPANSQTAQTDLLMTGGKLTKAEKIVYQPTSTSDQQLQLTKT
uniref:Variant surface glycoprotein 1125.1577 n=1 Tax=Trypanosoma brucei TaxID=5691 RepID=A0A1J0R7B9_9TRYP|nr:variant surface glycoprotein 1125.1577 [Trypanosoma brucei]